MTLIYKLDDTTFSQALQQAESLREQGDDAYYMAHALIYLMQENEKLKEVVATTKDYIHFGEDALVHQKLVKQLEELDEYYAETSKSDDPRFGLD